MEKSLTRLGLMSLKFPYMVGFRSRPPFASAKFDSTSVEIVRIVHLLLGTQENRTSNSTIERPELFLLVIRGFQCSLSRAGREKSGWSWGIPTDLIEAVNTKVAGGVHDSLV
jgi:hypothetical protein